MRLLRWILLLSWGGALLGSPVLPPHTTSGCTPGTLADYIAAPVGCSVGTSIPAGPFVYSDFSFSANAISGSPKLLNATDIIVTPLSPNINTLILQFTSSGFNVGSGQAAQYTVSYLIDPPPPEILHAGVSMVPDPPTPTGLSQVTTQLCVGAPFDGTVCPSGTVVNLSVFDNGTSSVLRDTVDFTGTVAVLGVIDTITLDATGVGHTSPASFNSFENTVVTSLPEPANGLLAGCGLAFLLFVVRSARAKLS